MVIHFKIFFFIKLIIWSYVFPSTHCLSCTPWILIFLNYCLISLCVFFASLLKTYRLLRKSIAWFSNVCEFYRYYFLLNEIMVYIIHINMCYLLKFVLLWVFPQFPQNPFSTCVAYALMNIPRETRLENWRNLCMCSPYFKNLYHYDLCPS